MHHEISTTSEPWVLLPYLYTLKRQGIYTEYGHYLLVDAVRDFCAEMPNGEDDYLASMRRFMLDLYGKASSRDIRYFLDKSPRYHLVADDVLRLFPDGKFIILWRNPLAIIASIIATWGSGRWNLFHYKVDLFDGMENLVRLHEQSGQSLIVVKYEDFLTRPEEEAKRICAELDIDWKPELLNSFSDVELKGRSGDPTGRKLYDTVSTAPLEKWKKILANPWRKAWCRRYLKWLGADRLERMGYLLDELLDELDSVPVSYKGLLSDLALAIYGLLYCALEPNILRHKISKLPEWKWIRKHD